MTVARAPHLRRAGLVITIASLALIGFETLSPEPGAAFGSHLCLLCGSLGGVSAILNVLLFVPLGIGLALAGFSGKRAVIAVCMLSALIETIQFLAISGRYSTIGDVLTNTFGGALGFAIGRHAFTLLRPSPRIALVLTMVWFAVWLAIEAISAFGFSPSIPRSEYYGQIARPVGNFEQFHGRVVRASIADVILTDARLDDSRKVRDLLLRGATITMTIMPPGPARGIAPIVRLADASQREIVLLAQNDADLIFGVRTGAALLRLRPPVFALPHVFPGVTPGDEPATAALTVGARYSAREAVVNTQSKAIHDRRIPITASLGWTMLLPFQWFIEGTPIELVVSAIWIACLILPIGYWGVDVARFPRARDATRISITAVPIALVLLYVGLVAVPRAFGVTAAPPSDWFGALTGILLGSGLRLAGLRWKQSGSHPVIAAKVA